MTTLMFILGIVVFVIGLAFSIALASWSAVIR